MTIALATEAYTEMRARVGAGYDGRSDADRRRHRAGWRSPFALFPLRDAGGARSPTSRWFGLRGRGSKLHLKRIAVRDPGAARLRLLRAFSTDFPESEANRVDSKSPRNDRARRAYEKAGFREEGVLRDWHRNADGSFATVGLMSVLRRDWEALP